MEDKTIVDWYNPVFIIGVSLVIFYTIVSVTLIGTHKSRERLLKSKGNKYD
jgi:hypothetical protein